MMTPEVILPEWVDMVAGCHRLHGLKPALHLQEHQVQLMQVRPYYMAPGWRVLPHAHNFYELSVVLRGAAVTGPEANGLGEGQVLGAGGLFFHAPGQVHSWSAPGQACWRLIFWFEVQPAVRWEAAGPWPEDAGVWGDCLRLLEVLRTGGAGWGERAVARTSAILAEVLALNEGRSPSLDRRDARTRFLEAVDDFLRDNLGRPIRLQDVAHCLGISASTLTHRYREYAGCTVGQRLLTLRLEQAERLLRTTDGTLGAIAHQVGLSDAAYLCRLFRQRYGTSPGEYRAAAEC